MPAWSHSVPTKVFDGFAAGTPVLAMNSELIRPFCDDLGMGIYVDSVKDLKRASLTDPKPYRKRVIANRDRFTTEREIHKVAELYGRLV